MQRLVEYVVDMPHAVRAGIIPRDVGATLMQPLRTNLPSLSVSTLTSSTSVPTTTTLSSQPLSSSSGQTSATLSSIAATIVNNAAPATISAHPAAPEAPVTLAQLPPAPAADMAGFAASTTASLTQDSSLEEIMQRAMNALGAHLPWPSRTDLSTTVSDTTSISALQTHAAPATGTAQQAASGAAAFAAEAVDQMSEAETLDQLLGRLALGAPLGVQHAAAAAPSGGQQVHGTAVVTVPTAYSATGSDTSIGIEDADDLQQSLASLGIPSLKDLDNMSIEELLALQPGSAAASSLSSQPELGVAGAMSDLSRSLHTIQEEGMSDLDDLSDGALSEVLSMALGSSMRAVGLSGEG